VFYPTLPLGFRETYYATQQRELVPTCVIIPESADALSQAIKIVREQECTFSVKSGGHTQVVGGSNIQNGLVFDLHKLSGIELSDDESTALVGTGAKWRDVYSKLQERGLLTVGGRVSSVAVGGLTLGGRFSMEQLKRDGPTV
jgi:FAD/FMN-containing dehydrogenase